MYYPMTNKMKLIKFALTALALYLIWKDNDEDNLKQNKNYGKNK